MKKAVGYIAYVLAICAFLYWGGKYEQNLKELANRTYDPWFHVVYLSAFNVFMGLVLAVPRFASNLQNTGYWKVDTLKLIIVGFPTMIISSSFLLYFTKIGILFPWVQYQESFTIAGVIFGYTILSSIGKTDDPKTIK